MSNQIARKYVKALMKSFDDKELKEIFLSLEELSSACKIDKFNNIIESPDMDSKKREEFVLSLNKNSNAKFVNFLKLLSQNNRLDLMPEICNELKYQEALKNNRFNGVIMSDFEITQDKISALEESFSKKFNSHIKLTKSDVEYPGVKVKIDDLGLEVSFSLERLKAQMSEYILKAI
ncbi:MAG: F0F1 ATP synthase subunit delta [Sulfurospirillum sp.]